MRRKLIFAVVIALLSIAVVFPAAAQGSTWYAEYYNNPTLSGTPAITRYENAMALNWGLGSPGPGVNADGFSARLTTNVSLNPGTYRFFMLADDNARLTFNYSTVVINTFDTAQVGQTVSGDLTVQNAGTYHLQIDYREVDQNAFIYLSWGNAATNPQPNFPVAPPTTGGGSGGGIPLTAPWTAQYYSNTALSGDPTAIVTIPQVNFNYAGGQPLASVPADNWSARFTSVQNLPGNTYTLRVQADDGVRVFVNGALVINQFGGATGQTFTAQLPLPNGANNFQVEYVEFGGNAFLDLQLVPPTPVLPTQQPVITGPSAIVTAFRLNVRQAPDPSSARLAQISRNETYAVLGRNLNSTWYLLQVGNIQGWASGRFLTIVNGANIPVVGGGGTTPTQQPGQNTGITVIATPYTVNIRSGPTTTASRLGRLPLNQTAQVIGRNSLNQWWQINYNGIIGWVTAEYTTIQPAGANVNSLPVTG